MPDYLVSASSTLPGGSAAPEWVMYMPGGEHSIKASKNGKPVALKVRITEADAAKLQAALTNLKQPGQPDPHVGFDHNSGPASFWPEEFAWRTEPAPGIYIKAQWTPKGKESVTAGEGERASYRYFSPTFLADDKGNLLGLPASGEIGSLVNNPAFRSIAALSASESQPPLSMNEEEIKALKAENEALKEGKKKTDEENLKMRTDAAESAVTSAITAGILPPQQKEIQDDWKERIIANPEKAKLLASQPAMFPVQATQIGGVMPVGGDKLKEADGATIYAAAQSMRSEALKAGNMMPWQVAWNSALTNAGLPLTCEKQELPKAS